MEPRFSGDVFVAYRQIYVESSSGFGCGLHAAFAGQNTGLCGAAEPGFLYLATGLHTGRVGFTVELHDTEPALDDSWEEAVEVSFRPASSRTDLTEWAGTAAYPLDLAETDYRVRYCATGMQAGHDLDTSPDDESVVDRCLLQFWPGPPGPDVLLKQTSTTAAHRRDFARGLPPAPAPAEREREQPRAEDLMRMPGGLSSTERLSSSMPGANAAGPDRP
ncbi:hypothetical protein [Streptomyces sp. NPDC008150]|uniref:hypothetical protein n=1 Tax=Streptomyces sp. NPDC008150 TaxID=3364816 RepID=UPI0036EA50CC